MHLMKALSAIAVVALSQAAYAQGGTPVKHIQTEKAAIATAVWVGDTLYVSGQLANPVTPADAAKGTPAVYGDTKTQSMSALTKIEAILKEQGLGMRDVVMMHVFLAGDYGQRRQARFCRHDGLLHSILRNQGPAQQARPERNAGGGAGRSRGVGRDRSDCGQAEVV